MKSKELMQVLIERHDGRMDMADSTWPDQPICPDCYLPLSVHRVPDHPEVPMTDCEVALYLAVAADMGRL